MAQLLVSIRDTAEAELINNCKVAIVDVKEPNRGSLGAATPNMLEAISRIIPQPQNPQLCGRRTFGLDVTLWPDFQSVSRKLLQEPLEHIRFHQARPGWNSSKQI